ncbi:MAG: MerR family transcriptional regulator [Desulfobacter sp.]|nr:MAG: MerR family transcriptional regulator [Desulfobacter sp.]
MKIRFQAGEMAQMHQISKQTLIYYDKIGLFRPREVDSATGYRYYHPDQCEDLDIILFLKSLGMTLREIKTYRNQDSIRDRIRLLESQGRTIEKKLDQILRARRQLDTMVQSLKASLAVTPYEKGIKWMEKRPLSSMEVPPPGDLYAMELCFKKMFRAAREAFDVDIHDFLVEVEQGPGGREIFKKVALPSKDRANDELPPGHYAYFFHKGPYEALAASRAELRDFIRDSGHRATGPALERVLLSKLAVLHEKDFLVEIQIPVEQRQKTG